MSKTLRITTLPFLAFVAVSFASPAISQPIEVGIGVSDNLAPRIVRILEKHPNVCAQDEFFSSEWLRTSLEFVIVCRAIRLGGLEATYAIQNYPNSARTRAELKKGRFTIMVDLPWGDFSKHESLYRSDPVLSVGDFVKGIYTRPDHTELLKVRSIEELRNFAAVSSKLWVYDWDALERMKVKRHAVPTYVSMGRMVAGGRADFLVGEFPGTDNLAQYIDGTRFIPVPGIKVVLPQSRHIAVSRRAPHSKRVFDAIQNGLKVMRKRGLIKQGYRAIGFFNPLVEDWKAICCEEE